MKDIKSILSHPDVVHIKWRLTGWCNYKCSYCLQKEHEYLQPSFENILLWAVDVNKLFNKVNKPISLNLIGGEITYFDLIKLFEVLDSPNLRRVSIVTNFSRPIEYFVSLAEYLNSRNIKFYLRASFHHEYTDIDRFTEKLALLKNEAPYIKCHSEFVLSPTTLSLLGPFKEACIRKNIDYLIELDKTQTEDFKQENLEFVTKEKSRYEIVYDDNSATKLSRSALLNTSSFEQIDTKTNLFKSKGYYCSAGLTYLYIRYSEIATNIHCSGYTPLKDFELPTDIRQCDRNTCNLCGVVSWSKDKNDIIKELDNLNRE